ncbi:unnamed protein product [Protopolystoma xenopodis]|uniref:Uncharacterized protein n=1 Tax=Protopolystoma xenopodis TaxID=117903 RepID=A0A3S5CTV9_9PLAT|nr:unnamed protein product [Protopolystoma xenopodis]
MVIRSLRLTDVEFWDEELDKLTRIFLNNVHPSEVCSADFCSQNLSDSNLSQELACQAQVDRALQEGCSPVIVDNTNIQAWEFRTYIEMARKADYIVMLVTPQTPWRFDTSECAARNCHDVSLDVCESKIRRFESVYPLYYAWFWPGRQSAHASANSGLAAYPVDEASRLLSWAWNTFDELLRLPIFQEDFRRLFELSSEANLDQLARCWRPTVDTIPSSEDSYMKHANFKSKLIHSAPTLTTRLHVTTHFSRFGREPGSLDYAHSGPVERALLGQLTTAKVTSILVTCRTICVKVSLNGLNDGGSNDTSKESTLERLLWMSDDQEVVNRSLDPESRHQARPINSSGGRCAQSK